MTIVFSIFSTLRVIKAFGQSLESEKRLNNFHALFFRKKDIYKYQMIQ